MKPSIAIINSSSFGNVFPEHLQKLEEFAKVERFQVPIDIPSDSFVERLMPFHGIIASVNPDYPSEVLQGLPNLVAITRHGIGYNNVAVAEASKLGIVVTRVPGPIERNAVAEHAVALLLSAARHIPSGYQAVKESRWADRASFVGFELSNKKVAVIGLGNIGSRTAEILKKGFDVELYAFDPQYTAEQIRAMGYISAPLEEVLPKVDCISLHPSLEEDTLHFLNEKKLSTLKKGVIIVNTARGEMIDDQAMINALRSNTVRCYAADVVAGEPILGNHPLAKEENVIIVPHLGGYTDESLFGMGQTMVDNMREIFTRNSIPDNALNADSVPILKSWS